MKIVHKKPAHTDKRGNITDILDGIVVDSVTIVNSKKGAIRGNHYHKKTSQYSYVLDGKFKLYTQQKGKKIKQKIVKKGDLVINPPYERHAFVALEDSILLACCYGPRAGKHYEEDTFRLEKPISGRTK